MTTECGFEDAEQLTKLIALMTLTLCWAIKTGEWLHQHHQPMQHASRASFARTAHTRHRHASHDFEAIASVLQPSAVRQKTWSQS